MRRPVAAALIVIMTLWPGTARAGEAPGAPGIDSAWTTGDKQGIGTSVTTASKLWFTLGQGIGHEVYYPQLDVPNVQDLQYLVSDGSTFFDAERDATERTVRLTDPRSLTYEQVNTARSGKYRITKTYTADPQRATMLVRTRFQALTGGPYRLYVLFNPSLNNSGMGDTGATANGKLVATDGPVSSALAVSSGFAKTSNGYSGTVSDGYQDLAADKRMDHAHDTASTPGNLVQTAQISVGADSTFTLALGFGATRTEAAATADASLQAGFTNRLTSYQTGWHNYLASLKPPPAGVAANSTQYRVALMTLKAHEDKTYRGANIASATIPWGQAVNANDPGGFGYHAVWSRDLYQVATAQLAAGDRAAAGRSADYLFNVQQRPDGSFPQNSYLDGRPAWPSLQMDEVAFPIVLAWHLSRQDLWPKVKKSADFIVAKGPSTPQERWEEEGGYSPSTIAAEIAGLVCAADLAAKAGDPTSAKRYLDTADTWHSKIADWTFTTTGGLGDGKYFIRIDDNGNPNDGHQLDINNGGGIHDERAIVDSGFLDLVRLGVKRHNDPQITASLQELDATTKVDTPSGPAWYRYNHDGYGETETGAPYTGAGKGRLWPLLTGERGEYELAATRDAKPMLAMMAKTANTGYMIPEQIWDRPDAHGFTFGKATGSASPLAWSMAQYVRLAWSIDAGAPVETPSVVKSRYAP
ncbi:glucan 1,4-alpha-glucosidase [Spirillospora sp. CA-294931]|uniref:glucan 1,4-alpha-glucosidase n=1 Tax=Spirillospora sp. CA-294931 TaxID=3240042 RepID=UPI003D8AB86D